MLPYATVCSHRLDEDEKESCCKICLKVENCKQSPSSVQEGNCAELGGVEWFGNCSQAVQMPFSLGLALLLGDCGPVTDQNFS